MASSFNLLGNAELDRILRINLPMRRLLFIGGFALAIVMVIAGLEWNSYAGKSYYTDYDKTLYFGRDTYWMLTVILFGLLFVLAPAMTALSFIQEKLRGTAIFQQMLLTKPLDIAVGKFFGSGAASYFAGVIILPFAIIAATIGNQSPESVFNLYLFLIVGGLCFQAVGLFVSAAISSPADKGLRGGLLVGPATGLFGAVTALYWYRYFTDYRGSGYYIWHFYGMDIEAYVVILALLIFIGVWAFAGAVRKIKTSQLVPVKAWPVWLFFVTAEALLVGILWGWHPSHYYDINSYGTAPISNLLFYLFINWAALLVLAGSIALGRNRLREYWSAGQDPLGLFQREEVRNNFKTFAIALSVSIAGLVALWTSYHMDAYDFPQNIAPIQLVAIVLGFAFTIAGTLSFVQYCAMQRFRARAWAGVGLVVAFYLVTGVAGAMFKDEGNTANLINPAIYAYEITKDDPFMNKATLVYNSYNEIVRDYSKPRVPEIVDEDSLMLHGFLAEGLLALGCFGLAFLKWRKIQDEMMKEQNSELRIQESE